MLICPQCQFENPDENRFCQECGTPLNLIVCPECGTRVPFTAERCHNCNAITGTYWWAIISQSAKAQLQPSPYLDSQQRYKIVEVVMPIAASSVAKSQKADARTSLQTRVLDCSPFQLSPLTLLLHQGKDLSQYIEDGTVSTGEPISDPWDDEETSQPASPRLSVPHVARPYLSLYSQFHQALPLIHDAWVQDGREIILLEDRSQLQSLLDVWADDTVPSLQVLHWLHEMTELWAALEPWQCRQSLLELKNLRLDEDQVLCLQQLYPELGGSDGNGGISLKNLGLLWRDLFSRTERTQLGQLASLIEAVSSGKITSIEDLQGQIYEIANHIQAQEVEAGDAEEDLPDVMLQQDEIAIPEPEDLFVASLPEDILPNSPLPTPAESGMEGISPDEIADDLGMSELYQQFQNQIAEDAVTLDLGDESLEDDSDDDDSDDDSKELDDTPTIVLPMQLYSLEDGGRTDVGRQRDHNEDSYGIITELQKVESPTGRVLQARGLYILCDGMGGHAGGEVASALAVDTIKQYFQSTWFSAGAPNQLPSQADIRKAVHLANKAIFDINQQNARSGSGRMGTTMVMILVQGTKVAVAHVGDSRLYCVSRRRGLEQLTTDHDVGQREIQRGVEPAIAYARPDAYQLTQALGPRDENYLNPDVQFLDINEDSLFLLCSDGLTDNDLLESHWRTHMEPLLSSQANLERGVAQLIELANENNGHDNITAVLVRLKVRPNLELMKR